MSSSCSTLKTATNPARSIGCPKRRSAIVSGQGRFHVLKSSVVNPVGAGDEFSDRIAGSPRSADFSSGALFHRRCRSSSCTQKVRRLILTGFRYDSTRVFFAYGIVSQSPSLSRDGYACAWSITLNAVTLYPAVAICLVPLTTLSHVCGIIRLKTLAKCLATPRLSHT